MLRLFHFLGEPFFTQEKVAKQGQTMYNEKVFLELYKPHGMDKEE